MFQTGSSFFIIDEHPLLGSAVRPSIVWLRGDHDLATDGALVRVLGEAIAANDAPLIVDMSDLRFIGASTLGIIVATRQFLAQHCRSLTVRSPSARVEHIIGICHLEFLLSPGGDEGGRTTADYPSTDSDVAESVASGATVCGAPRSSVELPSTMPEAASASSATRNPPTDAVLVERPSHMTSVRSTEGSCE